MRVQVAERHVERARCRRVGLQLLLRMCESVALEAGRVHFLGILASSLGGDGSDGAAPGAGSASGGAHVDGGAALPAVADTAKQNRAGAALSLLAGLGVCTPALRHDVVHWYGRLLAHHLSDFTAHDPAPGDDPVGDAVAGTEPLRAALADGSRALGAKASCKLRRLSHVCRERATQLHSPVAVLAADAAAAPQRAPEDAEGDGEAREHEEDNEERADAPDEAEHADPAVEEAQQEENEEEGEDGDDDEARRLGGAAAAKRRAQARARHAEQAPRVLERRPLFSPSRVLALQDVCSVDVTPAQLLQLPPDVAERRGLVSADLVEGALANQLGLFRSLCAAVSLRPALRQFSATAAVRIAPTPARSPSELAGAGGFAAPSRSTLPTATTSFNAALAAPWVALRLQGECCALLARKRRLCRLMRAVVIVQRFELSSGTRCSRHPRVRCGRPSAYPASRSSWANCSPQSSARWYSVLACPSS